MEASAREYGLFYSFGANPDIFQRMQKFNTEIGERRFNSQVLIRPQGILTNFKAKTNPFRFTDTWANMERDGMIDWSTPDAEMHSLEALRTEPSSKERRRPLFWRPFWTVAETPPCPLVPLSGFLASRRRKQRKNGEKSVKNGRDTAI